MKIPAKVLNCTTHHKACTCQEWRCEQMESALRIIHTWAGVAVASGMDCVSMEDMRDIRSKAHEALHCLDKIEKSRVVC